MKRTLSILLGILAWLAIIAYLVLASRYGDQQREGVLCREIRVEVRDSTKLNFITSAMVRRWFETEKKGIFQQEISRVNTLEVEEFIRRRGFVRQVRAYTTMDGVLHIELTQRRPIARVSSANGYNFYITEDHYILPTQRHEVTYVPVITGTILPPFERDYIGSLERVVEEDEKKVSKNYLFLSNLINFVKFIESDDFWSAFIVQIDLQGGERLGGYDPDVRIVPRAGNQIIHLGSLEGYSEKLDKLLRFYYHGMTYEGWDRYRYINLEYAGQIVCQQ